MYNHYDVDESICKVIATGSTGNCVLYHGNTIAVDMGISYAAIKPYIQSLKIVLLTHEHKDHFKIETIQRLSFEKPYLRFACGSFLADKLTGIRNVDILEYGQFYSYGAFDVCPVSLYHDVPNFGYRIRKNGYKILHCTDTKTLDGISAKNYDLYALEHNYDEDTVYDVIKDKLRNGEYAHQIGSINSHLSDQQSQEFILNNGTGDYKVVRLHMSKHV